MKLYLVNAEEIYFSQIKGYFREIVSSYDNGNYRSAIVMLYSTIVCDLLLKLKELSELYSDKKAEKMLEHVEKQRKAANKSAWEWDFIEKVYNETELLSDESYTMLQHIYDLRNFSAHPALTDDYELVSPSAEMTVAYIKGALDAIFIKPPVFAKSVVDRMSDDVAQKKEIIMSDREAFERYLHKAYLERMSNKMARQVFKAFWKFTFIKTEGDIYAENRFVNRQVLEIMAKNYGQDLCDYVGEESDYFTVAQESRCLLHICLFLSNFPGFYRCLPEVTQSQVQSFSGHGVELIKWFVVGDLEQHVAMYNNIQDILPKQFLGFFEQICISQGKPKLFSKLIIAHYASSGSFSSSRDRFDYNIQPNLEKFDGADFVDLIRAINSNQQIYNYSGQISRNKTIMTHAKEKLPATFKLDEYQHFDLGRQAAASDEDGDGGSDEAEVELFHE